mmetsp:Transcript_83259/g.209894  ORF Transcript_83259/g.209894 Transcript_83259/m.209894 type:complete len:216 (-) Transcript_83259:297-944(-)
MSSASAPSSSSSTASSILLTSRPRLQKEDSWDRILRSERLVEAASGLSRPSSKIAKEGWRMEAVRGVASWFSSPGERTLPTKMDDGVGSGALSGLRPALHSPATMLVISPSTDRPARADFTDNSTFCGVSSSKAPLGTRPGATIGVVSEEPALRVRVEELPMGVHPEELMGDTTSSRSKAGALRRPRARLKFTLPTHPVLRGLISAPKRSTGVSG